MMLTFEQVTTKTKLAKPAVDLYSGGFRPVIGTLPTAEHRIINLIPGPEARPHIVGLGTHGLGHHFRDRLLSWT